MKEIREKEHSPMEKQIIEIQDSFITLGQLLKLADIISSGGMAKPFLQQMKVFVNNEPENRRGKKLYHDDIVKVQNIGQFQIHSTTEQNS